MVGLLQGGLPEGVFNHGGGCGCWEHAQHSQDLQEHYAANEGQNCSDEVVGSLC